MAVVPGVEGYERSAERFISVSQSLRFEVVCGDFLSYLPRLGSRVLDAGSGAGQNAAALADMGYTVVGVEPMRAFLQAARTRYADKPVVWFEDSLPDLKTLGDASVSFQFILVDAVWHHLDVQERETALARFGDLLDSRGRCALSLRNGPAGLGTRVYQTDTQETLRMARALGFACIFLRENQPSILEGKDDVHWARIVLQKIV